MANFFARVLATLIVVAWTAIAGPGPLAYAQPYEQPTASINCPHGGNLASLACHLYAPIYDIYAQFNNNQMYVAPELIGAPTYGHINHTLWLYSGDPCNGFVEVGLTQGFQGQNVYTWYWGYAPVNGTAQAWQAWPYGQGVYPSPDGSTRAYWVAWDPIRAEYTTAIGTPSILYRVGWPVGPGNGLGSGGCIAEAGLELSDLGSRPDARFWSHTFDLTPLIWRNTFSTQGAPWWNWPCCYRWIDYPCGVPPDYPPYCLNGTYYGDGGYWADNKPLQ